MSGEFILDWKLLMYPLIAVGYFQVMKILDLRWSKKHPLTDEEILTRAARMQAKSEYEIFFVAAKNWHVADAQVEADFKNYLIRGRLPYYVKDYTRRVKGNIRANMQAGGLVHRWTNGLLDWRIGDGFTGEKKKETGKGKRKN